jgi:UDP-N-acetylmuramoylalanine--D-glutamate ligase
MYIIIGLGKTGLAVAKHLKRNNIEFICNDHKNASVPSELLQHFVKMPNDIPNVAITAMVLSPGISSIYSASNAFVLFANERKIPIISDIELFCKFFPNKKYIGITGTNGKSTTSTLVWEIFKNAGYNAALCGNIGVSPFANAIDAEICIVELSSFQLEITNVQLEIGAIINIIPDHLDRYHTLENYKKEKLKIVALSKKAIVNLELEIHGENVVTCSHIADADCKIVDDMIFVNGQKVCAFPKVRLLGVHNRQNILFAFAIAFEFGIPSDIILKTIENFNAIEHRIEFAGKLKGTTFYNDSKATNIDSTLNALRAINSPTFLIVGGKLVEDITNLFENDAFENVKMIAAIGSSAGVIVKELQKYNTNRPSRQIKFCISGNVEKAVKDLFFHAKNLNDAVVLLSPFCKSFDQFTSFEERGKLFKKCINELITIENDDNSSAGM